jgi:hypothetical protein
LCLIRIWDLKDRASFGTTAGSTSKSEKGKTSLIYQVWWGKVGPNPCPTTRLRGSLAETCFSLIVITFQQTLKA